MIQGVLNDRNNIFLHMYYAPFFLGSSKTFYWGYRDLNLLFTRQLLARKKGVKSGGVKENFDILGLFLILEITPCD